MWHPWFLTFVWTVGCPCCLVLPYLYHNVNVLLILQQTEIWIKVKLSIDGFCQDHLALTEGLQEDLVPLCLLLCQQDPLKNNTTRSHSSEIAEIKRTILKPSLKYDPNWRSSKLWRKNILSALEDKSLCSMAVICIWC